ncbi:hypothetical protein [Jeotgalibacillus proteolyticus]|uniref:hypothetical protein n=1 Tax=Jeotgalibacillus proteolyticus TaxID=2082395 RepID=UPI001ADACAFB|nr:hypothetical protein [Jeotgalibacillus proteolyticus]
MSTHSGKELEIEVESYNATEMNQKTNDREVDTIVIGDYILSRIDIKYVGPKAPQNTENSSE